MASFVLELNLTVINPRRRVERARDRKKRNRSTLYGESTDKTMNKILSTHLTPSPFPFTRFIPSPLETLSPRRRRLRCLDHQFLLPPPFSSPPPPPFSFLLPLLYVQEAIPLRSPLLFSRSPLSCCAALKRLPPLLFTTVVPSVVISLSRFSRFSRDEAAFNFVEYNIARCSTWSVMSTCREKKKKEKGRKKKGE